MSDISTPQKVTFAHMVAASENGVIGRDYEMLWKLPNDFKYFKNKTWGLAIIMGRKTYQALEKPLPGRYNIVITKNKDWVEDGVTVVHSLEESIAKAVETDCKKIFIIGGGEIFLQTINLVDTVYLTRVHAKFDGNVFYPELDESEWQLVSDEPHYKDGKHAFDYSFQVWQRIFAINP